MFSILKSVLASADDRRVTLLDCNTRERSIIFANLLTHLQAQYPDRFRLIHLHSRRVDEPAGPPEQ